MKYTFGTPVTNDPFCYVLKTLNGRVSYVTVCQLITIVARLRALKYRSLASHLCRFSVSVYALVHTGHAAVGWQERILSKTEILTILKNIHF